MRIVKLLLILSLVGLVDSLKANITSLSVSTTTPSICDTLIVTIEGTHRCALDSIAGVGIGHVFSSGRITIFLPIAGGVCTPLTPTPFRIVHRIPLNFMMVGSQSVRVQYNSVLSPISTVISVSGVCCLTKASLGNDTTLCNVDQLAVNGNRPPATGLGNWAVISGLGSLSTITQPKTTISNLSFGLNELVWTIVDTGCTTSDTIQIWRDELPFPVMTAVDKTLCEDTGHVSATPLTLGSGMWSSSTGPIILTPSSIKSTIALPNPGEFDFYWIAQNGSCQVIDTLKINYVALTDTPEITAANLELTSTVAPNYQWYKDGVPIPVATSQTYAVTSNGVYQVLATEDGCANGLFSNEIEFNTVGVRDINDNLSFKISPNPAYNQVNISGLDGNNAISLYQLDGKLVQSLSTAKNEVSLDLSDVAEGVYIVLINGGSAQYRKRLIVSR